jgi:hypothetical protein
LTPSPPDPAVIGDRERGRAPADSGANGMSLLPQRIFQSQVHRARAVVCEQRAAEATDATVKAEWTELAIEWHLVATVNARDEKSESGPS